MSVDHPAVVRAAKAVHAMNVASSHLDPDWGEGPGWSALRFHVVRPELCAGCLSASRRVRSIALAALGWVETPASEAATEAIGALLAVPPEAFREIDRAPDDRG